MNVNDFDVKIPEGDMLETIFNHQRDLMDKYHDVETRNVGHWLPSNSYLRGKSRPWSHAGPLNVQDRPSQLRMKDFAWRITEELTEATLAVGEEDETHYLEELIDALHFSVELLIMCGIEPDDLMVGHPHVEKLEQLFLNSSYQTGKIGPGGIFVYFVIEKLGEAMNRLKLKPWKTTGVLTDEKLFKESMVEFFARLITLLKTSGFTARTATAMYLNKNAVNQFRIASKY